MPHSRRFPRGRPARLTAGVLQPALEAVAEEVASAVEAVIDGLGGGAEDSGGFGGREVLPFAKDNDLPQVGGQAVHSRADSRRAFSGHDGTIGRGLGRRENIPKALAGGFAFSVQRDLRMAREPAVMVAGEVGAD